MTDEPERDYHPDVEAWIDSIVEVEHEPVLPSGHEPDFIVRTPFGSFVVEVENGVANHEIYNGLGQCLVYAHYTGHAPVLVLPDGHGYDGPDRFGRVRVVTV